MKTNFRKLWYLPLEPRLERYSYQLSRAVDGWLESSWLENNIPYERIEGKSLNERIKAGAVLDATGRGYWACAQVMRLLELINDNKVTSDDVIYFDDFWHPGIEALPYAFHILRIKPKMFTIIWAQSVDRHDFTYPMRHWMRHYEIGQGRVLDGIFVTSEALRDLCLYAGVGTADTVHVSGHPFSSDEIKSRCPVLLPARKNQVMFTSRWDTEKCPWLFLDIAELTIKKRSDISFLITTSTEKLKSNDPILLDMLNRYINKYPNNIILKENLTKDEYYQNLLESKVQINTADQDWVSYTLLESAVCGCHPLYPYYLSFPEVFTYKDGKIDTRFMYNKNDPYSASESILKIINMTDSKYEKINMSWIYSKFDDSWKRMIEIFNGDKAYTKQLDW